MNDGSNQPVAENNQPADDTIERELAEIFGLPVSAPEEEEPKVETAPVTEQPSPVHGGAGSKPEGGVVASAPPSVVPAPEPAQPGQSAPKDLTPLAQPAPSSADQPGGVTPPAPAAPTPQELELASLKAQVQALSEQLTKAAPASPEASTGDKPEENPVKYGLVVPNDVLDAVFSEDMQVAKSGLEHIINSISTIIHTNVRKEYQESINRFRSELSRSNSEADTQQQYAAFEEQYYNAFPQHKDASFRAVLASEAAQLSTEYPNLPLDANYINALGARVNQRLVELAKAAGMAPAMAPVAAPVPAQPVAPAGQPVPKPATMLPTTARSPAAGTEDSLTDFILDTITSE